MATALKLSSADDHYDALRVAHEAADQVNPLDVFTRNVALTLAQPPGRMEDRALVTEIVKLALRCRESAPQVADALRMVAAIAEDYSVIHRARREHLSETETTALFDAAPADLLAAERDARAQLLAEQCDAARDAEDLWDQRDAARAAELATLFGGC